MDISVGVISYKDENISTLIDDFLNQDLKKITIKEIIVVSEISVKSKKHKQIIDKYKQVKFVFQKRKGKYVAINTFLRFAKSSILVVSSGDIRLKKNTVENLCSHFSNNKIGIVSSQPIPKLQGENKYLDYTINLIWKIHHEISKTNPKFGELIGFRNLKFKLPKTFVDEEMIASIITRKGYKKKYAEKSFIYNKGPSSFLDLINQRRRIFCGHLILKKKYNYYVPTLNILKIIKNVFKVSGFNFLKINFSISLEAISRFLGYIDYVRGKDYTVWKIIEKNK